MAGNKANPAKSAAAAPKRDPSLWGVKDSNAKPGEVRIHTPVLGVNYELRSDEFTKMSEPHARKFLRDAAFVVVDEAGERVSPLDETAGLKAGDQIPHLRTDQTVASFDELSDAALLARAAQRPGGERFSAKSDRGDVIRFLSGTKPERVSDAAPPAGEYLDDTVEEMEEGEADSILEGGE